jgi:LysM repeat protein
VQAGDTLGGIAVKYGVTTAALIKANNLDNADALRIGQELVIPPP